MSNKDRVDIIAADLYEFHGTTYSIRQLALFLGISRDRAERFLHNIPPCLNDGKGKRYYYRDIAEAIVNVS